MGGPSSHDDRVDHLNRDWFGMAPDRNGAWVKRPALFPTGFWTGYQGDPEAILRTAIHPCARGVTRPAAGVAGDAIPDATSVARHWPVDVYWICQGPWFQCWVLWRQADTGADGHVTLLIATPAADGYPLTSKITRPVDVTDPPYTSAEYASPPPPDARHNRHGMWVVGHEDYTSTVVCSTAPGTQGPDRDAADRVDRGRREHRRHRRARGMGRRRPSRRPALREPVRE